jgi:microcystin-dependent protein
MAGPSVRLRQARRNGRALIAPRSIRSSGQILVTQFAQLPEGAATADFSANKPIQVPDKRGRTAFGLDDMGNSAAFRFIGVPFSVGDAITAGSLGGETAHTLTVGEMPAHDHGGATGNPTTHPSTADQTGQDESAAGSGRNVPQFATDKTLPDHVHTIPSQGGSAAHNNTPLLVVGTFYRKL